MAGQRKLHPAAERNALNRRDARLAHIFNLAERELRIVRQHHSFVEAMDFLKHLPDVSASHKGRCTFAGKHHCNDIILAGQMIDDNDKLVNRALIQRIYRRIGDGNGGDTLAGCHMIVLDQKITIAVIQRLNFGQFLLALPLVDNCFQLGQCFGIAQGRNISQIASLDQSADHPPHIFAASGFGKLADFDKIGWNCDCAFFGADKFKQAAAVVLSQFAPSDRDHESERG